MDVGCTVSFLTATMTMTMVVKAIRATRCCRPGHCLCKRCGKTHSSLNADGYHLMLGADYRSVCICPAKLYLST